VKAPAPQLRLIAEINRVARLALALQEPFTEAAAWTAFTTAPLTERDRPGFLERIFVPRQVPIHPRPYGDLFRLPRYPFFSTRPVPFTAISLRNGEVAAAFHAIEPERPPIALRVAADKVFEANGWRFPEDIVNPVAYQAIFELAYGGNPNRRGIVLPERSARSPFPRGEVGELALRTTPEAVSYESVALRWTPRTLAFHSSCYGII
jgi:hypothetical protein